MALVLAVYATHQNWKLAAQKLQEQLTKEKADVQKKIEEKKTLEEAYVAELKAKNDALTNLDTESKLAKKELDDKKKELDDLDKKFRETVQLTQDTQKNTSDLRVEVEKLRADNRKMLADYNAKFAEVVDKTDRLHQAANTNASLKANQMTLAQELARAKEVLNKFGLVPAPERYAGMPPFPVYGKVLANPGNGLVEISLGKDDGLMQGHKLEVYRISPNASTYLGRVEVVTTDIDRSVAKILPEFQKGIIQRGDNVASQFSNVSASK
jgi:hypothetical protein